MEDGKILAIVEERTRLLPEMDRRLREVTESQKVLSTRVDRTEDDIKTDRQKIDAIDDKVDNLKIWDRVWNGINSLVLAVLIYLQTGRMP
jgi:hypothetical protein